MNNVTIDEVNERVLRDFYKSKTGSFKSDALSALGISENPKANKAYDLAWEWGHAYGYNEIWLYLQELAELIR